MNILGVGFRGMIGQEIAKAHVARGDKVYIFDTLSNPYLDYSAPYVGEMINNHPLLYFYELADFLSKSKIDLISYQGSLVGVGESQYEVAKYSLYNVTYLGIFLKMLDDYGVHVPVLHAGSMGSYGEGSYYCRSCEERIAPTQRRGLTPICPYCGKELDTLDKMCSNESDDLRPISMYGITKTTQEMMWENYVRLRNMPVISLRYFSVYGMEQSPNNPKTGVLNMLANQLLNCDEVTLYEDGQQRRDLVNAKDIAVIHASLATRMMPGNDLCDPKFTPINVCTGRSHSLLTIADWMMKGTGIHKEVICTGETRIGDIRDVQGLNCRLKALGYNLTSSLEEDITTYCAWVMANKEKFITDSWEEEQLRCKKGGVL